jgi:hypothetical protein
LFLSFFLPFFLLSFFRSLSLSFCLFINVSLFYLSIDVAVYLSIYLPVSSQIILSTNLHI